MNVLHSMRPKDPRMRIRAQRPTVTGFRARHRQQNLSREALYVCLLVGCLQPGRPRWVNARKPSEAQCWSECLWDASTLCVLGHQPLRRNAILVLRGGNEPADTGTSPVQVLSKGPGNVDDWQDDSQVLQNSSNDTLEELMKDQEDQRLLDMGHSLLAFQPTDEEGAALMNSV
jgi:hypothetical protein